MANLWVKRVVGYRDAGFDGRGFPLSEPIYGEPEQCLPDSLVYAYRNGYVQCEAPSPGVVPEPALVRRPEPPIAKSAVAEDGWPVDAPRVSTRKKSRY